jgi:diguanylate cyclase (GGDEF)-like protein/PAS domain S-box-containing protein
VEPPKPDPDNMPNDTPDGADELRHTKGTPVVIPRWLHSAVENSSEIVTIVDPNGTLRYASPAWKRVLGYDPEEVVGTMNVLDHVHLDDLPHVLEETEEALSEGGIVSNKAEYRFRHADGSWRWIESVGTYLLDDPVVGGVLVTSRDVTERKEAEEALRKSEAEIFSILESITDAFFALDREWRFTYINSQAEVLFSKRREDLIGERIWEDPTFYPKYRRVVAEGKTARFEAYYPQSEAWYSVRAYPSESGISVYLQDVTQRKWAEERIRFQARLLDAVGQAVIATDRQGKIIYCNRAAEELYGWSEGEAMGRSGIEATAPENLWERADEIMSEMRAVRSWSGEYELRRKNGTLFHAMITITPVLDDEDNLVGIIGVTTDITELKETYERLAESERRFSTVVSSAHAFVYRCRSEPGLPYEYASDYVLELTGYSPEDLLVGGDVRYGELIIEEDRPKVWEEIQEALAEHRGFELRYSIHRKDGQIRHLQEYGKGVYGEDGEVEALEGLVYDATEQVRVEERLREAEQKYHTLVERVPAVVYIQEIGSPDSALYMSPQIQNLMGYSPEECKDPDLRWDMVHPDDRERMQSEDQRDVEPGEVFATEYRVLHRDGRTVWVRNESVMIEDEEGGSRYWQGFMLDITERKTLEEELRHRAFHDLLTDLPNRHLFMDRLGRTLNRTRRRARSKVAVLFMDLDNFKVVNDSLGHELGDELLVAVVERLRGLLQPEDTLARFGGDEFTVLIEDIDDPGEAVRVAERLVEALRDPFVIEERELFARASIGIALGDAHTKSSEELLRDADTAMYRAKADAAVYRVFDPDMYERVRERLELENHLRRALEKEEFRVYYQPKFRLGQTDEIEGLEALVRWEHPHRGLMLPDDFIPVAEETGLIFAIGGWVMREACRQVKEWQERYPSEPSLSVCVNLSADQVRHPGLLRDVRSTLRESGLEAGSLVLEITEGTLPKDTEMIETVFGELKTLGVRLTIVDFGREYSSLSYLKRLPVDGLKIDDSFVESLGEDPTNTTIVEAVIWLAHSLGLEVTGEGVKSAEKLGHLRRMGCDMGQGFFFSEPLPPEDVPEFLVQERTS